MANTPELPIPQISLPFALITLPSGKQYAIRKSEIRFIETKIDGDQDHIIHVHWIDAKAYPLKLCAPTLASYLDFMTKIIT